MPPGPGSQEVIWTYAPRDCVSPSIRNQLAGYSSSKPASSSRYVAAVKGKPGVSVGRGVAELITAVGSGVGETAACGLQAARNNKTTVTIKNGCKENLIYEVLSLQLFSVVARRVNDNGVIKRAVDDVSGAGNQRQVGEAVG